MTIAECAALIGPAIDTVPATWTSMSPPDELRPPSAVITLAGPGRETEGDIPTPAMPVWSLNRLAVIRPFGWVMPPAAAKATVPALSHPTVDGEPRRSAPPVRPIASLPWFAASGASAPPAETVPRTVSPLVFATVMSPRATRSPRPPMVLVPVKVTTAAEAMAAAGPGPVSRVAAMELLADWLMPSAVSRATVPAASAAGRNIVPIAIAPLTVSDRLPAAIVPDSASGTSLANCKGPAAVKPPSSPTRLAPRRSTAAALARTCPAPGPSSRSAVMAPPGWLMVPAAASTTVPALIGAAMTRLPPAPKASEAGLPGPGTPIVAAPSRVSDVVVLIRTSPVAVRAARRVMALAPCRSTVARLVGTPPGALRSSRLAVMAPLGWEIAAAVRSATVPALSPPARLALPIAMPPSMARVSVPVLAKAGAAIPPADTVPRMAMAVVLARKKSLRAPISPIAAMVLLPSSRIWRAVAWMPGRLGSLIRLVRIVPAGSLIVPVTARPMVPAFSSTGALAAPRTRLPSTTKARLAVFTGSGAARAPAESTPVTVRSPLLRNRKWPLEANEPRVPTVFAPARETSAAAWNTSPNPVPVSRRALTLLFWFSVIAPDATSEIVPAVNTAAVPPWPIARLPTATMAMRAVLADSWPIVGPAAMAPTMVRAALSLKAKLPAVVKAPSWLTTLVPRRSAAAASAMAAPGAGPVNRLATTPPFTSVMPPLASRATVPALSRALLLALPIRRSPVVSSITDAALPARMLPVRTRSWAVMMWILPALVKPPMAAMRLVPVRDTETVAVMGWPVAGPCSRLVAMMPCGSVMAPLAMRLTRPALIAPKPPAAPMARLPRTSRSMVVVLAGSGAGVPAIRPPAIFRPMLLAKAKSPVVVKPPSVVMVLAPRSDTDVAAS